MDMLLIGFQRLVEHVDRPAHKLFLLKKEEEEMTDRKKGRQRGRQRRVISGHGPLVGMATTSA